MKNLFTHITRSLLVMLISLMVVPTFAQATLSREEAALKSAEEKLEVKRLRLVDIKIEIEKADSLFVAGEKLLEDSKIIKDEAKDEVKAIEKQFKADSKPYNKAMKSKDRAEAAEGRADLREVTTKYKTDLKLAQTKVKNADRGIVNSGRMMDKADRKLDMLTKKLKVAEDAYQDAEEFLNDKKSGE